MASYPWFQRPIPDPLTLHILRILQSCQKSISLVSVSAEALAELRKNRDTAPLIQARRRNRDGVIYGQPACIPYALRRRCRIITVIRLKANSAHVAGSGMAVMFRLISPGVV